MQIIFLLTLTMLGLLSQSSIPLRAATQADTKFATLPDKVQRVVFLGDSITYSGQYVSDVEMYFVTRYPQRRLEFINVGLPSETVSGLSEPGHAGGQFPRPDLHERLSRVLDQTKPDLVFACYGMNDGIYMPFDAERFGKFKDGINWLHEQVTKTGAAIIHVTPPTFDELKGGHAGYSDTLGRYSQWLLQQRDVGWDVVDLHAPMDKYLEEHRRQDPNFAFAADGVHADDLGHWIMAQQILLHLGAKDIADAPDALAMTAVHPHGAELLKLIRQRGDMMKDAWLTATGHKRPGMAVGLPLKVAQEKAADLEQQIRTLIQAA